MLQRKLRKAGYDVDLAFDGEQGLAAWERGTYQLMAVDQDMPKMTGIELIRAIASRGPLPPTVMITGAGNESIAVEAMKLGADDYIIKDSQARYLDLIPSVIEQALARQRLLEEKRLAEEELRKFKTITDMAGYGVAMSDLEGNVIYLNQSFARMHGYEPDEVIGKNLSVFHTPEQITVVSELNDRVLREGSFQTEEVWHKRADGSIFPTLMSATLIRDNVGNPLFLTATAIDITDRKSAVEALRRSQRLLSVRDRISRIFLTIADKEMYGEVLELILEALHSSLGLFGYLDESGSLVWPSTAKHVRDQCLMPRKEVVLPSDSWGEVFNTLVNGKQSVCINGTVPVPAGHAPLKRVLGVPLIHREEVIGLVVAANKETDYDDDDRGLLESIGAHIAPVLQARLQREREEAHRRKTEEALRESEHMLQTILGTSPVGICSAENRKIIWINDAYRELFGFDSKEDYEGKDTSFLYASEEDYVRIGTMYDHLGDGTAKGTDAKWRRKDGSVFDGHVMMRAVDPSDPASGVICVLSDISWRKRAERFILQSERLKAIGELAGGVAHNFNNLLQVILGSSSLGLAKMEMGDHPGVKEHLQQIVESTKLGAQTVKRLQNFARVRTDDPGGGRVFDLSGTVKDAIEMSKIWWKTGPEKEGISISLHKYLTNTCLVQGNENELFEAVVNLIKNAVEALPHGGEILVNTEMEDDKVVLSVQDDGIGIEEEDQHRIFDPFWTTKDFERTGMGLSTCYGIVQRHGGNISVQSEPGTGTKICIKLPLALESSSEPPFPEVPRADVPLSVLVVDDLTAVVKQMESGLERFGHTVMTATSGQQALDIFREVKIDLVICDLAMPAMNGWQVGTAIKEICRQRGVEKPPFVMLTGWGGQINQPEKMAESGVDRVLEKPVETGQLIDVINELVGS